MKQHIFLFISVLSICISCKKVYNPDINSNQKVLVVEGLVTDEAEPYCVRLSRSLPYDNSGTVEYVRHAKVSIFDDCGNQYNLTESDYGNYYTNPAELIGRPGVSYTLHIETEDGTIYESSPQLMLPDNFNDSVYAEFTTKETLVEDGYGQSMKVSAPGVDLLTDIKNNSDSLPRFRLKSTIITESVLPPPSPQSSPPHCWYISSPDDLINITDEKYATVSSDIQKHSVCFIPTEYTYLADYNNSIVTATIVNRIIIISRFRVNQDAYQYYKNINALMLAEGKIFDPIAMQFRGNINCISNPQELAFGFFEASAKRVNAYFVRPGSKNVFTIPNVSDLPTIGGCSNDTVPNFWVN